MFSCKFVPHYSYKTLLLASYLLLFFACLPLSAYAAGEYSIENIAVDAAGKDTTDARNKALSGGETEAFKQYIIKNSPAKATEIIAKITPAQISAMVRGFEVVEEKMTAEHYHATLKYNFDPASMQKLLAPSASAATVSSPMPGASAAVSPGETDHIRKAVLVLPVLKEGRSLKLWQDDNKWRGNWYDAALEFGGGLVIAPLGDLDDRVDVDDTNVDNATTASLSHMLSRYGVGEVYVISAFYNEKADPKPTLEVTLKRLGQKTETTHMNYIIRSTEKPEALMARASNDIARSLYTQQTIDPNKIEYDRLKEINARINTSDIREWQILRKRLLAHGNIVGIRLTSISFYETTMTITFKGTPDILGKTLVAAGLRVMQDGDDLILALK